MIKVTVQSAATSRVRESSYTPNTLVNKFIDEDDLVADVTRCECEPIGETNVVECNCEKEWETYEIFYESDKDAEIDRLRKALEEVQQTVLHSDVSPAETLCIVYKIIHKALEPAKGEDESVESQDNQS